MLKIPSGNAKPQFVKLPVAACCPTSTLLAARVEHIGLIVPSEQTLNCQPKHISFVLLLPDWNWIRFNIQRFVFGHQISCLLVFFEVFCDSVSSTSLASARQNVHVETGTRHKSFSYRYLQLASAVITTKNGKYGNPDSGGRDDVQRPPIWCKRVGIRRSWYVFYTVLIHLRLSVYYCA